MRRSFSDVLDECLDRVMLRHEGVESCLASYPEFATELREALESALVVRQSLSIELDPELKRRARLRLFEAADRGRAARGGWSGWVRGLTEGGRRWAVTAAALVLALGVSGTSTVLAADESVPGDTLYPFKRAGERVRLMFAFTDAREAAFRTDLVGRRMDELEAVTRQGHDQFVPRLAHEIERHSQRARALTEASVSERVDAAKAAIRSAVETPPGAGEKPGHRVAVRAGPLLLVHARMGSAEERLRKLSEGSRRPIVGQKLREAAEVLRRNRTRTSTTLDQVDAIRLAAPEPGERTLNGPATWRRESAKVLAVEVVVTSGKTRLDLTVQLSDGKQLRVHLSPAAAHFLKGNEGDHPGRLRDLHIGSDVVIVIQQDTGLVRQVRTAPDDHDNDDGDD